MICGVVVKTLEKHEDKRGWLGEIFRTDEGWSPQMAYISLTHPFEVRGPHEHSKQSDHFTFIGKFRLQLWDNRIDGEREIIEIEEPTVVIIPPHVVHGYQNVDIENGIVINNPNKLYGGFMKNFPVDEIRHEDNPKYKMDILLPEWVME